MKWYNGSVLLFVVGLVKCATMSFDELQDFSNFLKETSLLDQPLKSKSYVSLQFSNFTFNQQSDWFTFLLCAFFRKSRR